MALQDPILYRRIVRWLKTIETLIKLVALALAGCLAVVLWNVNVAHRGYDALPRILTAMWILGGCLCALTACELAIIGPIRSTILRKRRRSHRCLSCGYRLDGATLRQGERICPECGWRDNEYVQLYFSRTQEI